MSLQSFGEFFILFPGYNGRMVSSWRHHADMLSDFVSTCSLPLSLPIWISLCIVSPPFCLTGICIPLASISYLSEDSFLPYRGLFYSFMTQICTNEHTYTHMHIPDSWHKCLPLGELQPYRRTENGELKYSKTGREGYLIFYNIYFYQITQLSAIRTSKN